MKNKVLLVDDEPLILELGMAALVKNPDIETLLASDGGQALEICASEHPGLVFLDVMMPDMDGFTVCREIKQDPSTAHIKVVVVSALAQRSTVEEAEAAGADGFMSKPFRPSELRRKVEELLDQDLAA